MHYPRILQPTHARWEQIDDNEAALTADHKHEEDDDESRTIFLPVDPLVSRNFRVVDTIFESAPSSLYGLPGPDGDELDVGFNGLSSVPEDIKAELPPDCLKAFEEALAREKEWKSRWGTETQNGLRRPLKIDKGVIG